MNLQHAINPLAADGVEGSHLCFVDEDTNINLWDKQMFNMVSIKRPFEIMLVK